jgi:Fe-S cluster assembly protein SufD
VSLAALAAATEKSGHPSLWTGASALRQAGATQVKALGWPGRKDEAFAHLNLKELAALLEGAPSDALADAPTPTVFLAPSIEAVAPLIAGSLQLVLHNGSWRAGDGNRAVDLPAGVEVLPLAEALDQVDHPVHALLNEAPPLVGSRALYPALNDAHLGAGLWIRVAGGTALGAPIEVVFESDGAQAVQHPRLVVQWGRGARGSLIERFVGHTLPATATSAITPPKALRAATNVVSQLHLEADSQLDHLILQEQGLDTAYLGHTEVSLAHQAQFSSFLWSAGARLARQQIRLVQQGPGTEAQLSGLYVGRGTQQQAVDLEVVHAQPHGSSAQVYKGILDEAATGLFSGTVVVAPSAPHTSATQLNKNLLLSTQAAAYTRPRLEIETDEVRCTHGATVGQLEADALFYLRSRGLDARTAGRLLTYAFCCDVSRHIPHPSLRQAVDARLRAWLDLPEELSAP